MKEENGLDCDVLEDTVHGPVKSVGEDEVVDIVNCSD